MCQLEWNALKAVQSQLRQNSYEWLRDKERRKHTEYQNCRKGKNKESTKAKNNLDKMYSNKKQKPYKKRNSVAKYRAYDSTISKVNVKRII